MTIEEFKAAAELSVSLASKSKSWQITVDAVNGGTQYFSTDCSAQQLLKDLTTSYPSMLVHRKTSSYDTVYDIIPVSSITAIRVDLR